MVIMGNIVMHKGRDLGDNVDQACANIRRLGSRKKVLLKTDNEPALVDLRNGVIEKLDQEVLVERPPKGESQSNGSVENAMKLFKGMLKTLRLDVERRLEGSIPSFHPIVAWLIEHTGENLTTYMIGKDGKTAYERLFGKPLHEETPEFGECVWFKRRKKRGP